MGKVTCVQCWMSTATQACASHNWRILKVLTVDVTWHVSITDDCDMLELRGTPKAHHELDGWVHTDAHDAFHLMHLGCLYRRFCYLLCQWVLRKSQKENHQNCMDLLLLLFYIFETKLTKLQQLGIVLAHSSSLCRWRGLSALRNVKPHSRSMASSEDFGESVRAEMCCVDCIRVWYVHDILYDIFMCLIVLYI